VSKPILSRGKKEGETLTHIKKSFKGRSKSGKTAPDGLSECALGYWSEIHTELSARCPALLLQRAELVHYCEQYAIARRSESEVQAQPTIYIDGSPVANPAHAVSIAARAQCQSLIDKHQSSPNHSPSNAPIPAPIPPRLTAQQQTYIHHRIHGSTKVDAYRAAYPQEAERHAKKMRRWACAPDTPGYTGIPYSYQMGQQSTPRATQRRLTYTQQRARLRLPALFG
jgi:phage terminase small subunit